MANSSAKQVWERLNNLALFRFLLLFASGWAFVQILNYFETVIVTFTAATLIAFLLSYPVQWLNRFLPRNLAVIVVFLSAIIVIFGLIITVGVTFLSQGQQLVNSITIFINSLIPFVEKFENLLRDRNIQVNLNVIAQQLQSQVIRGISGWLGYGLGFLQIFINNFISFILIAVVAFFMLLDGEKLWNFVLKILPENLQQRFNRIVRRKFLAFFRGQILLSLFLTVSTLIVFLLLNVPFSLILALIIGTVDMVPGIGATLAISIVCLIVLSQSAWLALQVLIACIILQQIQDNLIAPRVMQGSLNINPVLVFFALLVGVKLAGVLGIFIAIPMASVIVSLFEIEEMKSEI